MAYYSRVRATSRAPLLVRVELRLPTSIWTTMQRSETRFRTAQNAHHIVRVRGAGVLDIASARSLARPAYSVCLAGLLGLLARPYRPWESTCLKSRCWKRSIVPPRQTDRGARSQLTICRKPHHFSLRVSRPQFLPSHPHAYPRTRPHNAGARRIRTNEGSDTEVAASNKGRGSEGRLVLGWYGVRSTARQAVRPFSTPYSYVCLSSDGYDWDWIG